MIYTKPLLKKANKKALDFINWLSDERKEHNLEHLKDKNVIEIRRNGVDGNCYIDESLKDKLTEFINE
jgi:hypothetical protein